MLWPALGRADSTSPPATLHYEVAVGCADRSAFQAQLVSRLGADPFVSAAALDVWVRVKRTSHGYKAVLELSRNGDEVGLRSFSSTSCATALRATGLAIVLLLATQSREEPLPDEGPAASPVEPLRSASAPRVEMQNPLSITASTRTNPAEPRVRAEGYAMLGATVGVLPSTAEALSVGARFRRNDWSLGFEASRHGAGAAPIADGQVESRLWAGATVVCRHAGEVAFCGVLTGGVMMSQGRELATETLARTPYAAMGTRATWDYPLGSRFVVRVSADISATVLRARLQVTGTPMGEWTAPPVAGGIGMSLVGRLW